MTLKAYSKYPKISKIEKHFETIKEKCQESNGEIMPIAFGFTP